jgi:alkanesulfonate monooxygenase SsuD/methylene tetrahydromethanopterin reductase-like flavin-dependent oxidoreductase (luciferase family)/predicted kinase
MTAAGVTEIPAPALIVLVGPAGSGKTTWARNRYASNEIVSSDALRAVVGSGEADLDASKDAFAVLDAVVAARLRRGLTTVVDTLGLDADRRATLIQAGRAAGLPVVAVRFTTGLDLCRTRNRLRDRPVPAPVLKAQFQRSAAAELSGFDLVVQLDGAPDRGDEPGAPDPAAASVLVDPNSASSAKAQSTPAAPSALASSIAAARSGASPPTAPVTAAAPAAISAGGAVRRPALRFALQISAFPWGQDPRTWLREVAQQAEQVGFSAIAVMDHLLQIPQVGRAWDPIPEAFVTLGFLAGVTEHIELGALVTPVTFRSAPLLAKILASLDVVSGGRAFCGLGAGWYQREHAAYDIDFPPDKTRLDQLESTIGTLRAFWGPGTKPLGGLPETTSYPRPSNIPIIVGGGGERRTLEIAARLGDGCNVSSALPVLDRKLEVLRGHASAAGRSLADFRVTVLDLPIVGTSPDDVARLVESHRGRTSAKAYAAAHHAGTVNSHIVRYRQLADRGVHTIFVSFPDLTGPAEIDRFAPALQAFPAAPA